MLALRTAPLDQSFFFGVRDRVEPNTTIASQLELLAEANNAMKTQ